MRNQKPVFSTMSARPSAVRQDIFSRLNMTGLGDVRIYERALSADEVQALYNLVQ